MTDSIETKKIAMVLAPLMGEQNDMLPPQDSSAPMPSTVSQEEDKQLTDTDRASIQSILVYWFGHADNHWSLTYRLPTRVWFSGVPRVDRYIKENFEPLLLEIESALGDTSGSDSLLARWSTSPAGRLCLILLMDQFSRNIYRGTPRMFMFDEPALRIALEILDDPKHETVYSPPQRLFLYYCLEHTEDKELVAKSVELFGKLAVAFPEEKKYASQHRSAKQHLDMIEAFGRYPHRNQLLNREPTPAEIKFLATHRFGFMRSVQERGSEGNGNGDVKKSNPKKALQNRLKTRPMNILVLHGFRQNANIIRRALRPLERRLDGVATFTCLNAPHSYIAGSTPDGISDVKHPSWEHVLNYQRQWYSASDDGKVYAGMDVTLRYIDQAFKEKRFDGIIGFSQGATLIGILAGLQPYSHISFRFGICISGFPSRAEAHREISQPGSIYNTKTLHIYGVQDEHLGTPAEMEAKTRALAALFAKDTAVVESHPGGHFTPAKWPYERMEEFIVAQAVEDTNFDVDREVKIDGLEAKLEALIGHWKRRVRSEPSNSSVKKAKEEIVLFPIGMTKQVREVMQKWEPFKGLLEYPPVMRTRLLEDDAAITEFVEDAKLVSLDQKVVLDDLMLAAFATRTTFQEAEPTELFFRLWMRIYLAFDPAIVIDTLPLLVTYGSWKDLGRLAAVNAQIHKEELSIDNVAPNRFDTLHNAIVAFFTAQLERDRKIINSLEQNDPEQNDGSHDNDILCPSTCALGIPRIRSGVDKQCHLARDVALALYLLSSNSPAVDHNTVSKPLCYGSFTRLISRLCNCLKRTSPSYYVHQMELHRRKDRSSFFSEAERRAVLDAPPNEHVLNPEPMPVVPCSLEELDPLLRYMHSAGKLPEDGNVAFMVGTVTPDGRLDLCKQVVGPGGISPLLDAMRNSPVRRLLLGNNIVGDVGAERIAQYIRDPDSRIDTWYIAGNNFGEHAMSVICEALAYDTKVKALWLKRNPLKPAGAVPIARMLETNTGLETLDLLNTGILDEGVETVFTALRRNTTLRNIYVDTNGLTIRSATVLRRHLETGASHLRTLYLSCCQLGDEGSEELAKGLSHDTRLAHLGLASNCIGPRGCKAIVDALYQHPQLQSISLGLTRATIMLGGMSNYIGQEGAEYIAKNWLPRNKVIRAIDLSHNSIPAAGLETLKDALKENHTLTTLRIAQFGQAHSQNQVLKNEVEELLVRNRTAWGKEICEKNIADGQTELAVPGETEQLKWERVGREAAQLVEMPPWVADIMSVYRTK